MRGIGGGQRAAQQQALQAGGRRLVSLAVDDGAPCIPRPLSGRHVDPVEKGDRCRRQCRAWGWPPVAPDRSPDCVSIAQSAGAGKMAGGCWEWPLLCDCPRTAIEFAPFECGRSAVSTVGLRSVGGVARGRWRAVRRSNLGWRSAGRNPASRRGDRHKVPALLGIRRRSPRVAVRSGPSTARCAASAAHRTGWGQPNAQPVPTGRPLPNRWWAGSRPPAALSRWATRCPRPSTA